MGESLRTAVLTATHKFSVAGGSYASSSSGENDRIAAHSGQN